MKYVPRNKLLFWTGIVIFTFSVFAALVPEMEVISYCAFAGLLVMVMSDALIAYGKINGIKIDLPGVVRLSKGRESDFRMKIGNKDQLVGILRIALPFPLSFFSNKREMMVPLSYENTEIAVSWQVKALKTGTYKMDTCYLEMNSSMGFWACRTHSGVKTEIRVYPDLLTEYNNLTALFMNNQLGIHSLRQIGKGRDFEHLREYSTGDSYEDIHWKASARRGVPITKVYQVERTQDIYIIVDSSRLSARDSGQFGSSGCHTSDALEKHDNETILDRFVTAALITGKVAEKIGDMFGILVYADNVRRFIKAKSGKAHFNACRDLLYTIEPRRVTPDFIELFTFISNRIRKRSLLVFLTSLDDPVLSQSFMHNINILRRRHVVLVNMLNPPGAKVMFSSSEAGSLDDLYTHLGGHLLWESLEETEKLFGKRGVDFRRLDNEQLCVQLVSQYINVKKRQIL